MISAKRKQPNTLHVTYAAGALGGITAKSKTEIAAHISPLGLITQTLSAFLQSSSETQTRDKQTPPPGLRAGC